MRRAGTGRLGAVTVVLAAALTLGACTGGPDEPERTPEEVLAAARSNLERTSGVQLTLAADELPTGVDGVLRAEGVGTSAPAFEGDLKVRVGGVDFDVPVVATEGTLVAKLPFTTEFSEVDPADYSAPDPARLMAAEGGLSTLLSAVEDLEAGERVRSGEDVLSGFTGTVSGETVAGIIPSAVTEDDFDAAFAVDDSDRLREAAFTGQFYPGADEVTYTVTFDAYDVTADITLP
jgi:lipoprotein LprG